MSQSTASQPQQIARAAHNSREPARRSDSRQRTASQPTGRTGYTIAHAGRQVRFGPVVFWISVGTIVIMAGWSITTATYFAFRDDVLKGLIAHQAAQQYAYEDRIAELRARIDRTTSRQLLDQEQFEQKLDELMRRQVTLESRATALGGVADPTTTGAIRPAPKPSPMSDTMFNPQRIDRGKQSSIETKLGHVEASIERVEQRQVAALGEMQARYEGRARQVRGVLDSLGVKFNVAQAATGGPFVPVKLPPQGESFARALTRVSIARAQAEEIGNRLGSVPLRKPVTGEVDITSPFGVRVDPFVHEAAMHTGIDFRGTTGDPIHATAAGKVTVAGWTGGYGQMVEVDHGNGLATRYGHLSEIAVTVGQIVRVGQVIGRLGSTGRSTGPHLHYETRVDGEAVNPLKFLNAGARLFAE
jgi:murein DD-endopeptidase MepM/ murein hydrolase activator NlpD